MITKHKKSEGEQTDRRTCVPVLWQTRRAAVSSRGWCWGQTLLHNLPPWLCSPGRGAEPGWCLETKRRTLHSTAKIVDQIKNRSNLSKYRLLIDCKFRDQRALQYSHRTQHQKKPRWKDAVSNQTKHNQANSTKRQKKTKKNKDKRKKGCDSRQAAWQRWSYLFLNRHQYVSNMKKDGSAVIRHWTQI